MVYLIDKMSREQRISPRRQFVRPLSLIRDTGPAAPPETSAPLHQSRSADGEQADLTKFPTLQTEAVSIPGSPVQPLPPQSSFGGAPLTPAEPVSSSSWMMPQSGHNTSGLFAGPSSGALPQDGPISAPWVLPPQTERNRLMAWRDSTAWVQSQAEQQQ